MSQKTKNTITGSSTKLKMRNAFAVFEFCCAFAASVCINLFGTASKPETDCINAL